MRTRNHLLIFDYWEQAAKTEDKTLGNGAINPGDIADQNVIVLISHAHSDHYDPVILTWKGKIPNLTYIWGWKEKTDSALTQKVKSLGLEVQVGVAQNSGYCFFYKKKYF